MLKILYVFIATSKMEEMNYGWFQQILIIITKFIQFFIRKINTKDE